MSPPQTPQPTKLVGPSAPFGIVAGANSTLLAFASITAAADELAIESRPMPLSASQPVAHRRENLGLATRHDHQPKGPHEATLVVRGT